MKTQWKILALLTLSAGFVGFAACSGGGGGGSASDGQGNTISAQGGVTCYQAPATCPDGKLATAVPNAKDCPYQCGSASLDVKTRDGGTGTASATN